MGFLENGQWNTKEGFSISNTGSFDRPKSIFRHTISNKGPFKAEANRYHLYVSHACPWAHRTLIMRSLKKLTPLISVDVLHPNMNDKGWEFRSDYEACTGDSLYNKHALFELYQLADPTASCRVTVPVLWDKKTTTIVNNESSEIIRLFNTAFNSLTGTTSDYYPPTLRTPIDTFNKQIYDTLNNGVYKAGFAQQQAAYDTAVHALFETLDMLNKHLKSCTYLVGETLTEADIRLYVTLIRFDSVYHTHFKCNKKLIAQYPNISRYLKNLYEIPAFKNTTFHNHIKHHYYTSHPHINPYRIIPIGAFK